MMHIRATLMICERIFDIENAEVDCPQQQQLQ